MKEIFLIPVKSIPLYLAKPLSPVATKTSPRPSTLYLDPLETWSKSTALIVGLRSATTF